MQLAQFTIAPSLRDYHINVRMGWHKQVNEKTRSITLQGITHSYGCAHDHEGCNWRNKKVTLQVHVLHLKCKHGENIRQSRSEYFTCAIPLILTAVLQ